MKIWPFSRFETKQTDEQILALLGSASVDTITRAQALDVSVVNSAIRVISEAVATLDIKVVRVNEDGTETDQPSHPVAALLQGHVNDWTSGYEFVRNLVVQALTVDAGGIAWVNRAVDGKVLEILVYQPGKISVTYDDVGAPTYKIADRTLNAADIIHLRGPFDRCPLSMAMRPITVAYHLERHAHHLFKRGARPGGVIETPNGLGDKALANMTRSWGQAFEGSDNTGRTPILFGGSKFTPYTFNSTDAQFLENRKFQVIEICRAFRIPPSMAYELDRATWSNSEQMGREFLSYSLEPWLHALETSLRRALFGADERKSLKIVFDRDDLTRASLTERATAINSLRASKVLNANEGRSWLGLQPYDGGDVFENTNITTAVPNGSA